MRNGNIKNLGIMPGKSGRPQNGTLTVQGIERALQESELKFRTLFESASNAILIIRDGKITECNNQASELFGTFKEEITGKALTRFFPPRQPDGRKSRDKAQEKLNDALGGRQQFFEWVHRRADGSDFWAEVSLSRFDLDSRHYLMAFVRDISARKEAEQALQESEERYRGLFEGAIEGILVADIKTQKYILTNPAIQQMLGYSPGEMKKLGIWDIHPIESQHEVVNQVGELIKGEKNLAANIPCVRKDGSIFHADIRASWATVDARECLVSFLTDVTERQEAIKAVEERGNQLRTILNSLQVAVVIIDARTRTISNLNPMVATMIGVPAEEIKGTMCREFLCPDKDQICPILDQGLTLNNAECFLRRATGEEIPILKTVHTIWLGDQEFLLESFIDITEKKRLEAQIIQIQKIEAIGRLAGGIAHDFNNLLMAIFGHTELMLMKMEADNPLRKRVEEIKKAGERAASLTRQLLAFSRKQMLKPEVINLNKVVDNIEGMLKRLIGEDIALITSMQPELNNIKADVGQIDQIIMNLAVNARDAMPQGGKLIIETENVTVDKHFGRIFPEAQPGKFVCLSVADDGFGIDSSILQQIFDPFFTTKDGGTGLGLSVVYGIVKQHGGWIKVYSAPGIGSNFQIFFPVVSQDEKIEQPEAETLTENLIGHGETVMIVEDDESVRQVTVEVLIEYGYRVIEVGTGREALDEFRREKHKIDLVFSDIVLPDMNGFQLVRQLTLQKPGLPVVYVSGYPGKKSQWGDDFQEGTPFLQKPFTLTALLMALKDTLKECTSESDGQTRF